MAPLIDAWLIVVVAVAARLNREQSKALEYLLTENRVLKEQLESRGGRIRFTERHRTLLAAKAKELGRAALKRLDTIVTPDTLLRWRRQLIAKKYDGSGQLRRAASAYAAHYHRERNHQGLGNRLLDVRGLAANSDGSIECRERLGGLLRYYHRNAT